MNAAAPTAALMSGADYRESLRRYRPTVFVDGRRVESVADEPAFGPGLNAIGLTYDFARRPEYAPLMTAVQHSSGKTVNRMSHINRGTGDLLNKLEAVRLLCQETGCAQRYLTHDALNALAQLREVEIPMAVVVDEYGGVQGLVTATDILTSIAGELAETAEEGEPQIVHREDGSWLLDGSLPIDEVRDLLALRNLPADASFHTLAGLALHQFGHVPTGGENFELDGYRFEVVDMDGHRIDKVLATPFASATEADISTSG